ncbi:MAG TPA: M48 family metallopeptidase [Bryobacteraceae bacterium]|nr:M48 family metallopeptidase [Bryobacteraceae bacterium]
MVRKLQWSAAFFLVCSSAFAQLPKLKPGFNLFSKEQDVQLGREAASQVERQMPIVRDQEMNSYIQRIGQRLAATPEAGGFPYTFKLVNDKSVNAFALPGGPTFVNTGLIGAAENEAQLAGVIAHEISHVALRHGTNQASKANLIQIPAMIAGSVVGNGSMLGQLAQLGIGLGANSVLLKFSRSAERDADLLGAQIMARAGYNPIEMARFFEKLQAQGGHSGPQFLSDHPDPGNRVKAVQDEIRYLPQQQYANDSGQFRQMQSRLGSLPQEATRARTGGPVATGDPRPSGRFKTFQGQNFTLQYPDNWEVFGDPQAAAITIAPRSGLNQDRSGNVAVAYGIMASYYLPQGDRIDLRQDTANLIRQLQQSNPNMESGRRAAQNVRVDGQPGLATTILSESPYQGETEHDTLITVARPEGLFYMIFITPAREAGNLQNVFENVLRSVRFSR